jgi:hypothetical protein
MNVQPDLALHTYKCGNGRRVPQEGGKSLAGYPQQKRRRLAAFD